MKGVSQITNVANSTDLKLQKDNPYCCCDQTQQCGHDKFAAALTGTCARSST